MGRRLLARGTRTYLRVPGKMDATNWRAEQAIRPAVVNRKVWGGNRTEVGASAQSIVMSVFRTCQQRGREAFELIAKQIASSTTLTISSMAR